MNKMNDLVNKAAGKIGLTVMPIWRLRNLEATEHLRQLFKLYDVDLVVDVGANIGQFRNFLRLHVGYEGWIVSYEPAPESFEKLLQLSQGDDQWRVFQMALGSSHGTAKFNVSVDSTLSSFHKPDFTVSGHASQRRQTLREIEVSVDTIDRQLPKLLQTLSAKRPYLKMDTQGYDLEVVHGAEQSLSHFVGLQFEGSVVPLYEHMPPFTDMLKFLNERGFALSDMFPVTKDRSLRLIEFDCVMVKK